MPTIKSKAFSLQRVEEVDSGKKSDEFAGRKHVFEVGIRKINKGKNNRKEEESNTSQENTATKGKQKNL